LVNSIAKGAKPWDRKCVSVNLRFRVLVTGVFGYLGAALVHRLGSRFEIVGIGRPARAALALPVPTVVGDAADVASLLPVDAVIHLAGGGGPAKANADPARAVADHVGSTAALIAATREAPRFLFASTIAVYGTHHAPGRPYREDDPRAPDELYGALKAAAEELVSLRGGTSLRLANVYGAGCGVDLGLDGAVERFARAAARGGEISVYGTGEQRIDYVHVDDVVDAFAAALEARELPPAINVGSGAPVSIAELAEISAACGRGAQIVRLPAPAGKLWPDRSLDCALAERSLGWRPRVSLADGVRQLCDMMSGA